jgi:pyruvate dehydrogenase E2 component (dihydrolipoamide acetyltransferase)
MAEIVRMPKLSDTMTEGVVAEWHKNVGDSVESGELLAEIETDKATMEFESFLDGILLHIGVEKGAGAEVNSVLCVIGEKGEDFQSLLDDDAAQSATSSEPEVEEPKAPKPAPVKAPVVAKETAPATQVAPPRPVIVTSDNGRVFASNVAKSMAQVEGIPLNLIPGSGPNGRIIKRDVLDYLSRSSAGTSGMRRESFSEEPVSQMRKTIARRLSESKFTAPHFYLTIEIDMDNAISARKGINDRGTVKVSFNDMVIRAAATALKIHPKVNASWLEDTIRYNQHVHIGVAVAVEEGLLVPVVRYADTKNFAQINTEVKDYAEKAKNKKLQPEEWEGNTFTISNLGMFGIEEFTAIINPPDACILAVGGIKQTPVVKDGQIVPGNVMKVTLSCDHRVVDGATGAAFLNTFKENLENPVLMFV